MQERSPLSLPSRKFAMLHRVAQKHLNRSYEVARCRLTFYVDYLSGLSSEKGWIINVTHLVMFALIGYASRASSSQTFSQLLSSSVNLNKYSKAVARRHV